ncbi:hypothetical protein FKM82_008014 [Ascaphus truei]
MRISCFRKIQGIQKTMIILKKNVQVIFEILYCLKVGIIQTVLVGRQKYIQILPAFTSLHLFNVLCVCVHYSNIANVLHVFTLCIKKDGVVGGGMSALSSKIMVFPSL